ncbi:MAG: hypothetical protein ACI4VP_04940 [Clostridia bacterium]
MKKIVKIITSMMFITLVLGITTSNALQTTTNTMNLTSQEKTIINYPITDPNSYGSDSTRIINRNILYSDKTNIFCREHTTIIRFKYIL